jgi:hypothetical protein
MFDPCNLRDLFACLISYVDLTRDIFAYPLSRLGQVSNLLQSF